MVDAEIPTELHADSAALFERYRSEWALVGAEIVPDHWTERYDSALATQSNLEARGLWVSGPASLMGILGQRHLEVPHSKVLAWLLDPRGRHGLGASLLERFLAHAGVDDPIALRRVYVETEVLCEALERTGFVDVVVRSSEWTLVIENKIWSGQHGNQLDVYYEALRGEQTRFLFLTPGRLQPRSTRSDIEAAWKPIGWRTEVLPWLHDLLARGDVHVASSVEDYAIALKEEIG